MDKSTYRGKVLITGMRGFTGSHVATALKDHGFDCFGVGCDLLDRSGIEARVCSVKPDYVLHLAARSFVAETDIEAIYQSNVIGTVNLLDALVKLAVAPRKVILASSASVYGNLEQSLLTEAETARPNSHYGCSKLSMEYMAETFSDRLPLLITRPFNYIGVGQNKEFVIPKIICAYKDKVSLLKLGNVDIAREFNDVRDVSEIYVRLLTCVNAVGVVNICSGRSISLRKIIKYMDLISGMKMEIATEKEFIRKVETDYLTGSAEKLRSFIQFDFEYSVERTLRWMYSSYSAG